jgi:S1-C subfamily serine protease
MEREGFPALTALSEDLAALVAAVGPRVVRVDVAGRWYATGTVWNDGIVLATAHALRDSEDLHVISGDGNRHAARLAGWDFASDLALLRVDGLSAAGGAIAEQAVLRAGELAIVLARRGAGEPFARIAVVAGLVSAARGRGRARGERVIQLDLELFRGFSGGPLVDTRGRIVGLNTAGLVRGAALSLPVERVAPLVTELLARGRIARGYLGVRMEPVRLGRAAGNVDVTQSSGLLINALEAGGPAERAGTLVGDILVSVDGEAVEAPEEVLERLAGERIGKPIRLGVIRGGTRIDVSAVVGERPERPAQARRC